MFEGSFVALVTPFKDDESLDEAKLKELIEFQIDGGIHGIVPCGTTGESPSLSEEEHDRVIELTVGTVNGRVPVIAGTGSNSTTRTLRATEHAKAAGADAALIVTPYYNKPNQQGLYAHYMKVADSVDIPIIIYNVPGRCGRTFFRTPLLDSLNTRISWDSRRQPANLNAPAKWYQCALTILLYFRVMTSIPCRSSLSVERV